MSIFENENEVLKKKVPNYLFLMLKFHSLKQNYKTNYGYNIIKYNHYGNNTKNDNKLAYCDMGGYMKVKNFTKFLLK